MKVLLCARRLLGTGLVWIVFLLQLVTTTTTTTEAAPGGSSSPPSSYWVRSLTGVQEAFILVQQAMQLGGRKQRPPTKLKVVNVGLVRTGTFSFVTALTELGYTPIHDDVFGEVSDLYERAFLDPVNDAAYMTPAEWADEAGVFGFDVMGSGVILPYDFVEWAATQDDIKIIITLRDNPRQWAESFLSIQYAIDIFGSRPFIWLTGFQQVQRLLDHTFRNVCTNYQPDKARDIDTVMEGYEQHLKRIRKIVPRDKLLEFNVKQGWKPLCEFLNKPIPTDTSFPHLNDRVKYRYVLGTMWVITWTWPLLGLMTMYLSWLVVCRWGLRLLFKLLVDSKTEGNNDTPAAAAETKKDR